MLIADHGMKITLSFQANTCDTSVCQVIIYLFNFDNNNDNNDNDNDNDNNNDNYDDNNNDNNDEDNNNDVNNNNTNFLFAASVLFLFL